MIPPGMSEAGYEFKPFKYSSHYWILKLLEREREPVSILDVGAASGYLGRIWKKSGHHVTGIEFDAAAAEKAKENYHAFTVTDIETFDFPYRDEFDYVVFADVLEHLRDPAEVLRRCIPGLKESGKIIISLPNVANWMIRLSLLFGRFNYVERGILDRTHLRFFTLRSAGQLLSDASCEVLDVIPTPLPVQLVFPFTGNKFFRPMHEVHYALTRCWSSLFAYQFVLVTAPDPLRDPVESSLAGESRRPSERAVASL